MTHFKAFQLVKISLYIFQWLLAAKGDFHLFCNKFQKTYFPHSSTECGEKTEAGPLRMDSNIWMKWWPLQIPHISGHRFLTEQETLSELQSLTEVFPLCVNNAVKTMCHNAVSGGALDSLGALPCLGMFRRIMVDVRQLCESMCSIVSAVICLLSETQTFLPPWLCQRWYTRHLHSRKHHQVHVASFNVRRKGMGNWGGEKTKETLSSIKLVSGSCPTEWAHGSLAQ